MLRNEVGERKTAETKALNASKVKSELLANVSHEFRTPLNAISGYTDMLIMNIGSENLADVHRDRIASIRTAGGHLLKLVDSLLDLSSVESGEVVLYEERVKLSGLISSAKALIDTQKDGGGIAIIWPNVDGLPDIYVDEQRFLQVILNLLDNGVKFSPAGSIVELAFDFETTESFTMIVSDSGPGVSKEQLSALTDPFRRGRDPFVRERKGVGLGLTIVDRFVKIHGGTFVLESEVDQGTTAIVTLPGTRILISEEET